MSASFEQQKLESVESYDQQLLDQFQVIDHDTAPIVKPAATGGTASSASASASDVEAEKTKAAEQLSNLARQLLQLDKDLPGLQIDDDVNGDEDAEFQWVQSATTKQQAQLPVLCEASQQQPQAVSSAKPPVKSRLTSIPELRFSAGQDLYDIFFEAYHNRVSKIRQNPNFSLFQIKNADGDYAIHVACHHGSRLFVYDFLALGINPDLTDRFGRTALHIAAERGFYQIAAVLLKYGANPLIKDIAGKTPKEIAFQLRQEKLAMLINEFEENPNYILKSRVFNYLFDAVEKAKEFYTRERTSSRRIKPITLSELMRQEVEDAITTPLSPCTPRQSAAEIAKRASEIASAAAFTLSEAASSASASMPSAISRSDVVGPPSIAMQAWRKKYGKTAHDQAQEAHIK